jgi:holo-[acyl-carrier protein] synthase
MVYGKALRRHIRVRPFLVDQFVVLVSNPLFFAKSAFLSSGRMTVCRADDRRREYGAKDSMILGLGFDLVDLSRMRHSWERFGQKLALRVLHPEELAAMPAEAVSVLASRFAAKEAAAKALGTGFTDGIGMRDILVRSAPSGKPELVLREKAALRFAALGGKRLHLSLSHEKNTAGAGVRRED